MRGDGSACRHLRPQGPRLGPRHRHGPVRRAGVRAPRPSYQWILGHYYPGTPLGTGADTNRVLLASGRSSLSLGSADDFRRRVADGVGHGPGRSPSPATASSSLGKGPSAACRTTRFKPAGSPLRLSGARYRGTIRLRRSGGALGPEHASAELLRQGRRAQEMPSSWHLEALKAQAVAARSLLARGRGSARWFGATSVPEHLGPGLRRRYAAETTATNAAVDETSNEVLLSGSASPPPSSTRPRAAGPPPSPTSGAPPGLVPVPRQRPRPVRHDLAAPQLGPDDAETTAPTPAGTASGRRRRSSGSWGAARRARSRTSGSQPATAPGGSRRPGSTGPARAGRSRVRTHASSSASAPRGSRSASYA